MTLPKHLRPRVRYLAIGIETWPDASLDRQAFVRRLRETARKLVGDVGSAKLALSVLRFEFGDGEGEAVVRARRDEASTARAVLTCIEDIDGHPVGLQVRGMSGTIRTCEEKYIGKRPERVVERNVVFENASRPAAVRGDRVDIRIDDAFTGATDLDFERV